MSAWHVQDYDGMCEGPSTLREARAQLDGILEHARANAGEDGWPDDMERSSLFLEIDGIEEVSRVPSDGPWDEIVEYEVRQSPELADALAELLTARPSLCEAVLARLGRTR